MGDVPPAALRRLDALRALAADQGTTDHERSLAAERASALAARHGIALDPVDDQPVASPAPEMPFTPPDWPFGVVIVPAGFAGSTVTSSTGFMTGTVYFGWY